MEKQREISYSKKREGQKYHIFGKYTPPWYNAMPLRMNPKKIIWKNHTFIRIKIATLQRALYLCQNVFLCFLFRFTTYLYVRNLFFPTLMQNDVKNICEYASMHKKIIIYLQTFDSQTIHSIHKPLIYRISTLHFKTIHAKTFHSQIIRLQKQIKHSFSKAFTNHPIINQIIHLFILLSMHYNH